MKKFGPPFNIKDRWFKLEAKKGNFPFELVNESDLKLKFTPISLTWPRRARMLDDEDEVEEQHPLF